MILVDVHAHLDHIAFKKDLDKVIQKAKQAGVKVIITNGLDPETNRKSLELAKKYDIVKAALGIYPVDALAIESKTGEYPSKPALFDIDSEIKFIEKNKKNIAALGEIGLDFKHSDKKQEQIAVFKKLLELAEKINKPVIIHSRKAEREVIEVLETTKLKNIILHCFSGKKSSVKKALELDYNFSIPCNVVRSQQFQIIAELSPISQLFTETDSPMLSPYIGKRNEPSYIIEAIKKIAEIKKLDKEELSNNIYMNYQRIFQ